MTTNSGSEGEHKESDQRPWPGLLARTDGREEAHPDRGRTSPGGATEPRWLAWTRSVGTVKESRPLSVGQKVRLSFGKMPAEARVRGGGEGGP